MCYSTVSSLGSLGHTFEGLTLHRTDRILTLLTPMKVLKGTSLRSLL